MLNIELMPSNLDMGFENKQNKMEFKAPETNVNIDNNYENAKNKPSINGVELIGNKTSEDLGIIDIELIGEIKPESIEEDLKPNQVYNGNAIHDLARLFGIEVEAIKEKLPILLKEFDIEYTYEDNEVYNANAIHQLMEIFGQEIMSIVDMLDQKEDKQVYVDAEVNFNASTGTVSLRGWRTENPYQVIDEANKKGNPAILRVHLYANDQYMESLYMMQSIYSDTWWGKFKYFLGFVDDESFAYLRVNQNNSTTLGLKQF